MADTMLTNIGLTLDAQIDAFVNNWSDASKNISTGLSGMDATSA